MTIRTQSIDRKHRENVRIACLCVVNQARENGVSFSDLALLNAYFRVAAKLSRSNFYRNAYTECSSRLKMAIRHGMQDSFTIPPNDFGYIRDFAYSMCDLFDKTSDRKFRFAAETL